MVENPFIYADELNCALCEDNTIQTSSFAANVNDCPKEEVIELNPSILCAPFATITMGCMLVFLIV